MTGMPLVAVLAAGSGRRFGGAKLDADCAGRRLGSWVLQALHAAGASPGIIICPPTTPAFAADAEIQGWTMVTNSAASLGVGTSVATAARYAIAKRAPSLALFLADMPLITARMIDSVLRAEGGIAATSYGGDRRGVPARFPSSWFPALAALTGDRGAGSLFTEVPDSVWIEPDEHALLDVDCADGLATAAAYLARLPAVSSAWHQA